MPKAFPTPGSPTSAKNALDRSALSLFVKNGVDGTSIREIADGTSFSNAAIFKHYDSKEALALALFERCYDELALSVTASFPDTGFQEQMHELVLRYLKFMDSDLEAALYVQENLRRYWSKLPKRADRISLLGHLRKIVSSGQAQGVVAGDKEPRLLVAVVIGLLGQFARMLYFKEFSGPASGFAAQISRLAIDACREIDSNPSKSAR